MKLSNVTSEKRIIGIGVFIYKEGKILLGHQYKSYEEPCWSAPGGKLDPMQRSVRDNVI